MLESFLKFPLKKKGKGSFYIAQYPVRWPVQSASHFFRPHQFIFWITDQSMFSHRLEGENIVGLGKW